ncbi:DUF1841 family protein [Granulosicoccus sp. 3-233]|uniref:DUF1841 family protein n=1 Tax=Granulosicoccus sp. 3-233 TaxID=3417969 RepID=UPI003D32AF47
MLFTQDRTRTRQMFRSTWQKHTRGDMLEPLEKQIASLLEEHPEYHSLLTGNDDVVDHDFTAEDGHENPFLHLSLHLALREQVGTDRPAGIASITRSLLLKHGDGHKVEHMMIERLGLFLWEAQRQSRAPDEQAYLASLRELL